MGMVNKNKFSWESAERAWNFLSFLSVSIFPRAGKMNSSLSIPLLVFTAVAKVVHFLMLIFTLEIVQHVQHSIACEGAKRVRVYSIYAEAQVAEG